MAQIRECMANAQNLTWDEQVELRDRLLELNKDMLSILMAL